MPDFNPKTSVSLVEIVRKKINAGSGIPRSLRKEQILQDIKKYSVNYINNKELGNLSI